MWSVITRTTVADAASAESLLDDLGLSDFRSARATCKSLRLAARSRSILLVTNAVVNHFGACRARALRALASVATGGDTRASAVAAAYVSDPFSDIRRAAASAFAHSIPAEDADTSDFAVAVLGPALADTDDRVCLAAGRALSQIVPRGGSTTAVARASMLLQSTSVSALTRQAALEVLSGVALRGDANIVAAVAAALCEDVDWRVRASAARALPRLADRGDSVAYTALRQAMDDDHGVVRNVATGAVVHVAVLPSLPFFERAADAWTPPRRAPRRRRPQVPSTTPPARPSKLSPLRGDVGGHNAAVKRARKA